MSGDVTFTLTADDYVDANRIWASANRQWRYMEWLTPAVAIFGFGDVALDMLRGSTFGEAVIQSDWLLIVTTILIFVRFLEPAITCRNVRRMLAQNKALTSSIRCHWDNRAVAFFGANGNSDLVWRELHRWIGGERCFVFLPSDRMMLILPTRFLSAEQVADLQTVASEFGPRPG